MGLGSSSNANVNIYQNSNQNEKDYLIIFPEEAILKQQIEVPGEKTQAIPNKENYIFTKHIINELFLNYPILTEEKSQIDVFQKIILPNFSQCPIPGSDQIFLVKNQFAYNKGYSKYFVEMHNQFLSQFHFSKSEKAIEPPGDQKETITINDFRTIYPIVDKKKNTFDFAFLANSIKETNPSFLEMIQQNPQDFPLLVSSFFFSLYNNDIFQLLTTMKHLFSIQQPPDYRKLPTISLCQSLQQSQLHISSELYKGTINYSYDPSGYDLPREYFSNILAATPRFLFLYNCKTTLKNPPHILQISLENNNVADNSSRFKTIELSSSLFYSSQHYITAVDNCLLSVDSKSRLSLLDLSSQLNSRIVSCKIKKGTLQFPFTSDGHFVYSFLSHNEIGVFELHDFQSLDLVRTIHLISRNIDQLKKPYHEKLIYPKMLTEGIIFTNGIELSIINILEVGNNQFTYFVRKISLLTGCHICDEEIQYHNPITSICFEPISRKIWVAICFPTLVKFECLEYTGPEPLWLSRSSCINLFERIRKKATKDSFVQFATNYLHCLFSTQCGCQFDKDDPILSFFLGYDKMMEVPSLIMELLTAQQTNYQFIQSLFIVLYYHIVFSRLNKKQLKQLVKLLTQFIGVPELQAFIKLFIIQITNNLHDRDISLLYTHLIQSISKDYHDISFTLLLISLRLAKSKKFPYVLDNQYLSSFLNQIYCPNMLEDSYHFISNYQAALFRVFSYTLKKYPERAESIQFIAITYSSSIIQLAIEYKDRMTNPFFYHLFSKFLLFLKLTFNAPSFYRSVLPLLAQLMISYLSVKELDLTKQNSLSKVFLDVYFYYILGYKKMVTFQDLDILKRYEQFLNLEIGKERTISEIFDNQIKDDEFKTIVNTFYQKVSHPLNKRLTPEDREFEQNIFLSVIYQSNLKEKIIELHRKIQNNETIAIPGEISQMVRDVYRIRSDLRSKKQNEDQTLYLNKYQSITDKYQFLLKCNSNSNEVKKIIDFISNDLEIAELILAKNKLGDLNQTMSLFTVMANHLFISNFPPVLLYLFLSYACEDSELLENYDVLSKYTKIDLHTTEELIQNVLSNIGKMPPNAMICFVILALFMLSKSYTKDELHKIYFYTFRQFLDSLIQVSSTMPQYVFRSNIAIICHLIRIVHDNDLFIMTPEENEQLRTILQKLSLKDSMSFGFSHNFVNAFLKPILPVNIIHTILSLIGQPKFHSASILLYDQLLDYIEMNKNSVFCESILTLLEIIGSVFSGSQSEQLLQIAVESQDLSVSPHNKFVRTSSSQIACALELVQVIRKLLTDQNPKVCQMVVACFNQCSQIDQLQKERTSIKRLFGMFVVISNVTQIIRPNTIVTTNENKTYFVRSLDFTGYELHGLLLPISEKQIVQHAIHSSPELKSSELIPYQLSQFGNVCIPFPHFELAFKAQMTNYSDSLLSFFALRCVRENLMDPEHGAAFSELLLSKLQDVTISRFNFRENAPLVLSLLRKSLVTKTDGIFVGSLVKPKFFHASFSQVVFNNDFLVNQNTMKTEETSHVFISSILDDTNPIYFSIAIDCLVQGPTFGVITHSVDQNQSVSVTYSSPESGFCVNGVCAHYEEIPRRTLIECRYFPSKNKVSFASENSEHPLFVLRLQPQSRCSFIVFLYPHSTLSYNCSLEPQTNYFKKTPRLKQIFSPIKLARRVANAFQKKKCIDESETKFLTLRQDDAEDNLEEIVHYSAANLAMAKNDKTILQTGNSEEPNDFASFSKLRETQIYITTYPNCLYQSTLNIYSSPQLLNKYVQVEETSGRYQAIAPEFASMESLNYIPPFHFENYHYLPVEVINCYFSGVCEMHRQEVSTLFIARILANSNDIQSILNKFTITTEMLVKFVTSILLLLEPIRMTNLNENKSPIDFESFNGFNTCAKTELFDYYSGLTQIINYLHNSNKKTEFINDWFSSLQKDFQNKDMHFATRQNGKVRIVRSSIINTFQSFTDDKASGWIIFPFQFGCATMPQIEVNQLTFPKSFNDKVNYAYNESTLLNIMNNMHSNYQIAFGLLPFSAKSNESLFYTFYQLVISFKYFVLFASKDLNEEQKIQLRSFIFTAISAASPYFYTHSDAILSFLNEKIPVSFTPKYISFLNLFIGSTSSYNQLGINQFISKQCSLFNDITGKYYSYYLDDNQKVPEEITLPAPVFPSSLSRQQMNNVNLLVFLERILLPRNEEFPFYLILNEWAHSFAMFPPCDTEFVEPNVLSITFKAYVPAKFYLTDIDIGKNEEIQISYTNNFDTYSMARMKSIPTQKPPSDQSPIVKNVYLVTESCTFNKVFVRFHQHTNLFQHHMIVTTESIDPKEIPLLAYHCRSFFSVDLNEWQTGFSTNDNQQILVKIKPEYYSASTVSTLLLPITLCSMDTVTHSTHMIRLRAVFLIVFNFICRHNPSLLQTCESEMLQSCLSVYFISNRFYREVLNHSNSETCDIRIDRANRHAVREGLSNSIFQSMIGQFSSRYHESNNKNRMKNDRKLFHVSFVGENGVDCGGLMREFASEIVADINCPNIGLFILTPNGRNHQGKYQECLIPTPHPRISSSGLLYHAVGAFIAMSIRCQIQQAGFVFPPLFWNFIISNELRIEDIYDIDVSYKRLITNIIAASQTLSDSEFEESMSGITVTNSRGDVISFGLSNRDLAPGRLIRSNVQRFIAFSNECRINELKIPLTNIRNGFWDNMGFTPPRYVSPLLIEYLACGEKVITISSLREAVQFRNISLSQRQYFWAAVERMSNDDRKKLLQFSTGIQSIDKHQGLIVDYQSGSGFRLPTASTCFFQLHLPSYKNASEMYRALILAINETQSFENA